MPKKLLSIYVSVGTGAARLAFNLTSRAVRVAMDATGFGGAAAQQAPPRAAEQAPPRATEHAPSAADRATENGQPPVAESRSAPETVPDPEAREPGIDYDAEPATPIDRAAEVAKTIDDEPELVDELAEPGAEEGAGASVEIDEPWEGYSDVHANEVIARIENSSAAELAVLELYERAHKQRQTVLAAAERRLRAISGPATG